MDKERSSETMKLGAFFHPTGNHVAAWLHPDAQIDAGTNFRHYTEITQTAERGKFDLMFVADAVATRDGKLEALSRLRHAATRARTNSRTWQSSRMWGAEALASTCYIIYFRSNLSICLSITKV